MYVVVLWVRVGGSFLSSGRMITRRVSRVARPGRRKKCARADFLGCAAVNCMLLVAGCLRPCTIFVSFVLCLSIQNYLLALDRDG